MFQHCPDQLLFHDLGRTFFLINNLSKSSPDPGKPSYHIPTSNLTPFSCQDSAELIPKSMTEYSQNVQVFLSCVCLCDFIRTSDLFQTLFFQTWGCHPPPFTTTAGVTHQSVYAATSLEGSNQPYNQVEAWKKNIYCNFMRKNIWKPRQITLRVYGISPSVAIVTNFSRLSHPSLYCCNENIARGPRISSPLL